MSDRDRARELIESIIADERSQPSFRDEAHPGPICWREWALTDPLLFDHAGFDYWIECGVVECGVCSACVDFHWSEWDGTWQ